MYQKLPQRPLDFYGEKKYKLGEGTFGAVYKYRKGPLGKGEEYAVKKFVGLNSSAIREISALLSVPKTPYVMPIIDVAVDDKFEVINMVMLLGLFSLDKVKGEKNEPLKNVKDSSPTGFKRYLWQMATGVAELHRADIWHRDIKPQNIIYFDITDDFAISDLGSARTQSCPNKNNFYTRDVYTLWYRSPEILLGYNDRNLKADVWALGCVFYEILTGQVLFNGDSEIDMIFTIFRTLGTPLSSDEFFSTLPEWQRTFPRWGVGLLPKMIEENSNLDYHSEQLASLIIKMLAINPNDRISIFEVLDDPYFSSINKDKIVKPLSCWESTQLMVIEPKYNPDFQNRNEYIDTLIECGEYLRMRYETIFKAIFIMDRLALSGNYTRDILYISLYIANIYNEIYKKDLESFYQFAEHRDYKGGATGWTAKLETEDETIRSLQKLDWSLNHPTAYDMLSILLEDKLLDKIDDLDEIMMQEVKSMEYFKHPAIFAKELLEKYSERLLH